MAAPIEGVAQAPKPRMGEDRPKRRGKRSGSGRRPRQNRAA
jgi:hypothetical protein